MQLRKSMSVREIMPPLVTILVMLFILSTILLTRVTIREEKVKAESKEDFSCSNSDSNKDEIRNILLNNLSITALAQNDSTYYQYISNLIIYLQRPQVTLDGTQTERVKDRAKELINIINLEEEYDFTRMSLDGRAIAINIADQIYDICGLKLETDMNGNIQQIADQSGNLLYIHNGHKVQSNFQVLAFIITFITIIVLLGIVLFVGKKNQLFEKEVRYHGFNEKRYA